MYFDELVIRTTPIRTGAFTPPTEAPSGGGGTGAYKYYPQITFGEPNTPIYYPGTSGTSGTDGAPIDIGNINFTIEVKWRIANLFEMSPGDDPIRYTIIGQFEDVLRPDDSETPIKSWWALEFIDDKIYFRMWDAGANMYRVDLSADLAINWAAAFTDHVKENLDSEFVHIAVARYGNQAKLFINGVTVDTGSISSWPPIYRELQVNGQTARAEPDLPRSLTYISGLSITPWVLYWGDFIVSMIDIGQFTGLAFYPRVFPYIVRGRPGDIYA